MFASQNVVYYTSTPSLLTQRSRRSRRSNISPSTAALPSPSTASSLRCIASPTMVGVDITGLEDFDVFNTVGISPYKVQLVDLNDLRVRRRHTLLRLHPDHRGGAPAPAHTSLEQLNSLLSNTSPRRQPPLRRSIVGDEMVCTTRSV
jgi:hypothetical protein